MQYKDFSQYGKIISQHMKISILSSLWRRKISISLFAIMFTLTINVKRAKRCCSTIERSSDLARKSSNIFRKWSKTFPWPTDGIWIIFKNLRKSSDIELNSQTEISSLCAPMYCIFYLYICCPVPISLLNSGSGNQILINDVRGPFYKNFS